MVTSTVRSSSLASIMRTGTPPASACSISVCRVRRAGGVQRFLVNGSRHQGPPLTRLNSADSRIDAGRRRCTSGRGDLPPSGRSSKPVGSPVGSHRQTVQRRRSSTAPQHRHRQTAWPHHASARRITPASPTTTASGGASRFARDAHDFRADATDIALGDQQGRRPHHAGLGRSMNWWSKPSSAATWVPTARTPKRSVA